MRLDWIDKAESGWDAVTKAPDPAVVANDARGLVPDLFSAIRELRRRLQGAKARMRRYRAALVAAEAALADLGACDDPDCREPACAHALPMVRQALRGGMAAGSRKARRQSRRVRGAVA